MIPWLNSVERYKLFLSKGHWIRKRVIQEYLGSHDSAAVQFAPGTLSITNDGWLTADIAGNPDIYFDASKELPFPDQSIDYIFHEHFLEHLTYDTAVRFLWESNRILKIGGVMRIVVPDFAKVVEYYHSDDTTFLAGMLQTLKRMIPDDPILQRMEYLSRSDWANLMLYVYDHKAAWDQGLFEETLQTLGFTDIKICSPNISEHSMLNGIERHRELDAMNDEYVIVVEASKKYDTLQMTRLTERFEQFLNN